MRRPRGPRNERPSAETAPGVTRRPRAARVAPARTPACPMPAPPASRPLDAGRVAGLDLDHGEVAVGVERRATRPPGRGGRRRSVTVDLVAAQVVGVGQHPALGDDDAGCRAPAAARPTTAGPALAATSADRLLTAPRALLMSSLSLPSHSCIAICKLLPSGRQASQARIRWAHGRRRPAHRLPLAAEALAPRRRPLDAAGRRGAARGPAPVRRPAVERLPGIAPNILTDRLRSLERDALVRRPALLATGRRARPTSSPPRARALAGARAPARRLGRAHASGGAGPPRAPAARRSRCAGTARPASSAVDEDAAEGLHYA